MANNNSARKRIEIAKRNQLINKFYKSSTKTLIKTYLKNVEIYNHSQNLIERKIAQNSLSNLYSLLDKGVKKNVFHRNNASRKKSRLSAFLKIT